MPAENSERWTRLEELFHQSLEMPAPQRVAFVDEQTGTDPDLREQLLALIRSVDGDDDFLEPSQSTAPGGVDLSGRGIGGYTLRRLIAVGGMGAVYEAEQERPKRLVALKLLKTGFPSRSARRRFEFEAELLARLDHPGVARVHEAGVHEGDGIPVPYFAMELVSGAQDIATYCDQRGLSVRQRVALCVQVSDAVEHGHQRGVLHRDLKPGNVLVDEEGRPKVIDFGVARATNQDPSETMATLAGEIVGTLSYMSPEQTMGDPILVDVRSDVYALGGLLHRLLTGKSPHPVQGLGVAEALRVVQEVPIPSPSRTIPEVAGDLETVLLGALAKSRDERYATVNAFAEDLRRWLRSEPIQRTPPSTWHRLQLFLRRNRKVAAATAAFVVVLVSATVISLNYGLTAKTALDQERKTSQRSDEVSRFLQRILDAAAPMSNFGREAKVSDVLAEAKALVDGGAIDDQDVEAEVRAILGGAYFALGDYAEASRQYERMEELWSTVPTPRREFSARQRIQYARMLNELNQPEKARTLIVAAREDLAEVLGSDHSEVWFAEEALSVVLRSESKFEEAIRLGTKALERLKQILGPTHESVLVARERFTQTLLRAGKHREAEVELNEQLQVWLERRGPEDPRTLFCRRSLGDVLTGLHRPEEAEEHLVAVVAQVETIWGPTHVNTITSRLQLGRVLGMLGRYDEALAIYEDLLRITDQLPQVREQARANLYSSVVRVELARGDGAAAEEAGEIAVVSLEAMFGEDNYTVAKERLQIARAISMQGRHEEAEARIVVDLAALTAALGDEHLTVLDARLVHAANLRAMGELERALDEVEATRLLLEATQGERHVMTVGAVGDQAVLLARLGRQGEAQAAVEECIRRAILIWPAGHVEEAAAQACFGRVHGDEVLMNRGYEALVARFGPRHPRATRIAGWMVEHLRAAGRDGEAAVWEAR